MDPELAATLPQVLQQLEGLHGAVEATGGRLKYHRDSCHISDSIADALRGLIKAEQQKVEDAAKKVRKANLSYRTACRVARSRMKEIRVIGEIALREEQP